MGSLIYIAAIVLFAIFSNLNKASKNKGKPGSRGGMPSFGGGGDGGHPLGRSRVPARPPEGQGPDRPPGSRFPQPGAYRADPYRSEPERGEGPSPAWPEAAELPSPDYGTGEGMSLEQAGDTDGVVARTERMQQELERLQAAFDGMAAAVPATGPGTEGAGAEPPLTVPHGHPLAGGREALRSGLMWAEILGPPRSRKPYASRHKEG